MSLAPMQDILSLDGSARMNYPSRLGGNWSRRLHDNNLAENLAGKLSELN